MGTIAILILSVALLAMAGVYVYGERRHAAQIAEIIKRSASNAKACAELENRLNELKAEFNNAEGEIDAQTAEKMWKQGIDNIMNYTLEQAMGAMGGMSNGRN